MEEEKKEIRTSLSTVLLFIAIIIIVVMGIIIYNLSSGNNNELETQADALNNLQEKIDSIEKKINSNANDVKMSNIETKVISGTFYGVGNPNTDAPSYMFNDDGTMELQGNFSLYGKYTISGDTIKITYTEEDDYNYNKVKLKEESKESLVIKDENTLIKILDDGSEYKYIKSQSQNTEELDIETAKNILQKYFELMATKEGAGNNAFLVALGVTDSVERDMTKKIETNSIPPYLYKTNIKYEDFKNKILTYISSRLFNEKYANSFVELNGDLYYDAYDGASGYKVKISDIKLESRSLNKYVYNVERDITDIAGEETDSVKVTIIKENGRFVVDNDGFN